MNPRRAVRRGRKVAEQMMVDTVDVVSPSGGWTQDVDGNQVPAVSTVVSGSRAWVRVLPQQSRIVESGGQPVTLMSYDVLLPESTAGIAVDDLVKVTASEGTGLQGKTLTVLDVTHGTFQVARRLVCRDQQGG